MTGDGPAPDLPRLVLVRHAPTAWSGVRYAGRSDPPLTAAGRGIARTVAGHLAAWLPWRGPGAVRLVSSPSGRARGTAEPIARRLEVPVELDDRWAEVDVGRFEGRTWAELETADPALSARLLAGADDIDWPDGERAADFRERIAEAVRAVLADPRPTIVVSHAGSIRLAVTLATDRPPADVPFPEPGGVVPLRAAELVPGRPGS